MSDIQDKEVKPPIYTPFYIYNRDDLSAIEKLMYGLVVGLCNNKGGYCYAKNDALAKLLGLSSGDAANKHLSKLIKKNLLKNIGTRKNRKLVETVKRETMTHSSQNGLNDDIQAKMASSSSQNGFYKPIIYKLNTLIGHFRSNDLEELDEKRSFDLLFEYLWNTYNHKHQKQDTVKLFKKLKEHEIIELIVVLPSVNAYHDKVGKTHFVPEKPYPTTFLRQKRWEDECYLVQKNSQKGAEKSAVPEVVDEGVAACVGRMMSVVDDGLETLEPVDHAVVVALGWDKDELIDMVLHYTPAVLSKKVSKVWHTISQEVA